MKSSDWKPRLGAICRIQTLKKDGADAQAPPGTWMVLDKAADPGCWWLVPSDMEARVWAARHPEEAKFMSRHSTRLMRPGGKP